MNARLISYLVISLFLLKLVLCYSGPHVMPSSLLCCTGPRDYINSHVRCTFRSPQAQSHSAICCLYGLLTRWCCLLFSEISKYFDTLSISRRRTPSLLSDSQQQGGDWISLWFWGSSRRDVPDANFYFFGSRIRWKVAVHPYELLAWSPCPAAAKKEPDLTRGNLVHPFLPKQGSTDE